MVRLSKTSLALVRFSPIALMIAFAACGTGTDPNPLGTGGSGGPGSGGTGNSTGGNSGNSGGNSSGAGGGNNNSGGSEDQGAGGDSAGAGGGSSGTGGGSGSFDGVPGAEGYDCSAATGEVPALKATKVADVPSAMLLAHEPGGEANRLYVLDGSGKVMLVKDGTVSTFLDFSSKVYAALKAGDETGALGLAFHPGYKTNGLFYVHYSEGAGSSADTIIEEYKVSDADADVADPASARLVIKVDQPSTKNHKGGAINFGKDGYLYIGLGDGGGSGDPSGNGQNVAALLAKILRINPLKEGDNAYTIPAGNLKDTMPTAAPEVWDYGLRNPFRSTFDGCTGDFYIGDVGQDRIEEFNVEKVGEGGKNYGWNEMEGTECYYPCGQTSCTPVTDCDKSSVPPQHDYPDTEGVSITGGAVYRGSAIPALRGTYFFADYWTNKVWRTVYDRGAGTVSEPVRVQSLNEGVEGITAINNGADGELYIVSLSDGVFKIEAE